MKLHDLLHVDHLGEEIANGYVKETLHPEMPLVILNYTASCQYERRWNDVTRTCRGLIYHAESLEVIARPWPKFYNYGEHEDGSLDARARCEATDKMDGSLGICFRGEDGLLHVASRGSFTSDQAVEGTKILREYIDDVAWDPDPSLTYLFEIVFPENRVVVDYGSTRALFGLGAVEIETGRAHGPESIIWPGPVAQTFGHRTLGEALQMEPRPNAEGVVIRMLGSDLMVKIKQDDYIAIHKLVFGLNERVIWERLGAGESTASICEGLPDEFHGWIEDVAERLFTERDELRHDIALAYERVLSALQNNLGPNIGEGWTRKDFALEAVKEKPLTPFLFMLLDEKDLEPAIWKLVKPSGANTLKSVSEDVA